MGIFEKHPHYSRVLEVCNKLKANNFQAWLAGGCVRDFLLDVMPKDFDVATDAKPDDIQRLFPHSLDIGKQFGIIMVPFGEFQVEVATFRSDGEYKDGRRPVDVKFASPEEDAKRRDFTINAMFYDPITNKILDFVEGRKDLQAKIIKAVGDPLKRFEEDKLRILRAVRFSAQLDFEIEPETFKAMQKRRREVVVVSKERIHQELSRMMESKALIRGLKYLKESHLHEVILESFKHFNDFELRFDKVILLLKNHKNLSPTTKWSLFFHPFFENTFNSLTAIEQFLKDYKFSSRTIKGVMFNYDKLKWMQTFMAHRDGEVIEFIFSEEGKEFLSYYAELPHDNQDLDKMQRILKLRSWYQKLPAPLVDGYTLKEMGLSEGPEFKKILKLIYHHQLEKKITSRDDLIAWTKAQKF